MIAHSPCFRYPNDIRNGVMMRNLALIFGLTVMTTSALAAEDKLLFMTPSRNIACQFMVDQNNRLYCVRRDAKRSTEAVPFLDAAIELGKGKASTTPFSGDAWYPDGAHILAYGKSVTHAGVTCTSRRSGLTCKNKSHGFTVNSKKITVY
jgi:hypothetical protein